MEAGTRAGPSYTFGDWTVEPTLNRLSNGGTSAQIERLSMDVLRYLLERPGQVVSADELLAALWGDRHSDPGMVQKRIAQLRRVLSDDPRHPTFIETVRTRGYRTVAPVVRTADESLPGAPYEVSKVPASLLVGLALLAIIGAGTVWLGQGTGAQPELSSAPLTAIAVLPFDDLSPDGGHEWLAMGLADDLIEALNRIDGLLVPARRSTSILKAQGADLDTIAERLDVGTVIEGSVQASGSEISVVTRWVRIGDGRSLWSARYDREANDILEIQRDISVGIAEAIRVELGIRDAPASLLEHRYATSDVRAWELLKKAGPLMDTLDPDKVAESKRMLQQALKYDPNFTAAQQNLSFIDYLGDAETGIQGVKAVYREDPTNVWALSVLMFDSATRFWDYETAERFLDLIPEQQRTVGVLDSAFHVYANTGRLRDALKAAEHAVRLDPMYARAHCLVGFALDWSGQWEAAIPHYERALGVAEDTGQFGTWCAWDLADLYRRAGRQAEIVPMILGTGLWTEFSEVIRRGWKSGGWKGLNLALADAIVSRAGRRETMALTQMVYSCPYHCFAEAGATKRLEECLGAELDATRLDEPPQQIRQSLQRLLLAQIRVHSAFARYRSEPGFQRVLRRLDERMQRAAGTYERRLGIEDYSD